MQRYKVVKTLGKGSFGTVVLVEPKATLGQGKRMCIKKVDIRRISKKERDAAMGEAKLLERFTHPNIVKYVERFVDDGILCIVMELAEGGDLHAKLRRQGGRLLPEETILEWFTQICLGMQHVHKQHVLHRDIKTQNIFLAGGDKTIKIGDFGISKVMENTMQMAKTKVGTPYYLSPEICKGKLYDHKSDIWSLGVVLYELTTLKHPFTGNSMGDLSRKIVRGKYTPPPKSFSADLRKLIADMLSIDPAQRPDITEVLERSCCWKHAQGQPGQPAVQPQQPQQQPQLPEPSPQRQAKAPRPHYQQVEPHLGAHGRQRRERAALLMQRSWVQKKRRKQKALQQQAQAKEQEQLRQQRQQQQQQAALKRQRAQQQRWQQPQPQPQPPVTARQLVVGGRPRESAALAHARALRAPELVNGRLLPHSPALPQRPENKAAADGVQSRPATRPPDGAARHPAYQAAVRPSRVISAPVERPAQKVQFAKHNGPNRRSNINHGAMRRKKGVQDRRRALPAAKFVAAPQKKDHKVLAAVMREPSAVREQRKRREQRMRVWEMKQRGRRGI